MPAQVPGSSADNTRRTKERSARTEPPSGGVKSMQIKPTGTGSAAGTGPERARESRSSAPTVSEGRIAPRDGRPRSDSIEISGAARELLEARPPEDIETTQLDPQRARTILDRLGDGYYERPDVRSEVLRRIAADLGLSSD